MPLIAPPICKSQHRSEAPICKCLERFGGAPGSLVRHRKPVYVRDALPLR
jgi:hypothetical protein